jgi:hypothetical protein
MPQILGGSALLSRSNVFSAGLALGFSFGLSLSLASVLMCLFGNSAQARRLPAECPPVGWLEVDLSSPENGIPGNGKPTKDSSLLPPLQKGMKWLYQGTVEVGSTGKKRVSLIQEVEEVVTKKNITAVLLKGHPRDLWFYEKDRLGRYLWVCVDNKKLYEVDGARIDEVFKLVNEGRDPLAKLGVSDLVIDGPMHLNQFFGNDPQRAPMFCWNVESISSVAPYMRRFPCVVDSRNRRTYVYTLIYRANTDHTIVKFIPGLGYVAYSGEHHGTVSTFDVTLRSLTYPK